MHSYTSMSFLFSSSSTPSYAAEQLTHHLSSISTLPVNLTVTSAQKGHSDKPSRHLEEALSELSASKPPTRDQLIAVLEALAKQQEGNGRFAVQSEMDRVVEGEVLGRAVTVLWKEVLDELLSDALTLEKEKTWWDGVLNSRTGVPIYLLQSGCLSSGYFLTERQPYRIGSSRPFHPGRHSPSIH